jgi:hypothetical protein
VASREGSENHNKEFSRRFGEEGTPLYVKYTDLVLFKNCNPDEMNLGIRETMGWLIGENSEAVLICFDRPVELLANEQIGSAGLVIPKDCILEKHKVRIKKPFNHSSISYSGQKKPYKMEK